MVKSQKPQRITEWRWKMQRTRRDASSRASSTKFCGGLKQPSWPRSNRHNVLSRVKHSQRNRWSRRRDWRKGKIRRVAVTSKTQRRCSRHPTSISRTLSPIQGSGKWCALFPDTQTASGEDVTNCKSLPYRSYIVNETRSLEFKRGRGGYMDHIFYKDVCIYGCAFLNSGGGTLLIGVCDNGVVCGVHFSHEKEDRARRQVDCIVKNFDPPLLPRNYSLKFLPVVEPGEVEHHLKVLCLTFKAPPAFTEPTLFMIDGGKAYVRLDGSVWGPLGASVIQEWCRQMWTNKVQRLKEDLHEATSEKWFLSGQLQGLIQSIELLCQIIEQPDKKASKGVKRRRT